MSYATQHMFFKILKDNLDGTLLIEAPLYVPRLITIPVVDGEQLIGDDFIREINRQMNAYNEEITAPYDKESSQAALVRMKLLLEGSDGATA